MRLQRVYQFVVVLVLIFPAKIFSQKLSPRIAQISPHALQVSCCSSLKISTGYFNKLIDQDKFLLPKSRLILQSPNAGEVVSTVTVQQIAYSRSYLLHLGFFCQKEYQFERSTSVPLRVRLGSLAYVDKMEGKK
jgi:hypothetical protein